MSTLLPLSRGAAGGVSATASGTATMGRGELGVWSVGGELDVWSVEGTWSMRGEFGVWREWGELGVSAV